LEGTKKGDPRPKSPQEGGRALGPNKGNQAQSQIGNRNGLEKREDLSRLSVCIQPGKKNKFRLRKQILPRKALVKMQVQRVFQKKQGGNRQPPSKTAALDAPVKKGGGVKGLGVEIPSFHWGETFH